MRAGATLVAALSNVVFRERLPRLLIRRLLAVLLTTRLPRAVLCALAGAGVGACRAAGEAGRGRRARLSRLRRRAQHALARDQVGVGRDAARECGDGRRQERPQRVALHPAPIKILSKCIQRHTMRALREPHVL